MCEKTIAQLKAQKQLVNHAKGREDYTKEQGEEGKAPSLKLTLLLGKSRS